MSPRSPLGLACLLLFVARFLTPAHAATAPSAGAPRETWYGVYLNGKRAGYLMSREQPTRWRDRKADLSVTRMRMDLRVLGAANTSEMESKEWATPEGAPLETSSVERTGGCTSRVRAVFTAASVTFDADLAGVRRHGTLRLKPGERFWSEDPFSGKRHRPAHPARVRYKTFNTTTLALEDADVTVGARTRAAKREVVEVGGLGVAAYKVAIKMGGVPATVWLDAHDDVLRFDVGPARFIRQPKQVAAAPLSDGAEVTEVTVYRPEGRPLLAPRTLRGARYRIDNLSAPLAAVDDDVQTTVLERKADGGYAARITVATGPAGDAPPTPLSGIDRRGAHAAYLRPSLYVPSDTAQMKALARRILGGETDAARAAGLLSDWVHKTMAYDAGRGIGVQRHASEILKSRRGVCQDYATLLVTLARAAGIPAKHCSGLAYGEDRFFLHAWAELWVGKWVALEPTWGAPFADATHIKLAEGEPTTERAGLSRLDPLRITVLETAASPAIIQGNHEP